MLDPMTVAARLVEHARQIAGARLALVFTYGSRANGLARPNSDLDIAYIADPDAPSPAVTFVLDGLPYDFWPIGWERLERMADGRDAFAHAASLVQSATVLYARSDEDRGRLTDIQSALAARLTPERRPEMRRRAREALDAAARHHVALLRAGDDARARRAARHLAESVADALALANQRVLKRVWQDGYPALMALPERPDDLDGALDRLLGPDTDRARDAAGALVDALDTMLEEPPSPTSPTDALDGVYYFVHEYRNKIVDACARGDAAAAAAAAFVLQENLEEILAPTGPDAYRAAELPNLIDAAVERDMDALHRETQRLDRTFRARMVRHCVSTDILDGSKALERLLESRRTQAAGCAPPPDRVS